MLMRRASFNLKVPEFCEAPLISEKVVMLNTIRKYLSIELTKHSYEEHELQPSCQEIYHRK